MCTMNIVTLTQWFFLQRVTAFMSESAVLMGLKSQGHIVNGLYNLWLIDRPTQRLLLAAQK